ncbi:MAG: MotA/TolQ/ExbB proton channel family protein [Candidatus Omnitrophica bacterium]|nr:MotA/TolQ/ExbB proton channel family protein [Candidatus Omnitrophota bacterium]
MTFSFKRLVTVLLLVGVVLFFGQCVLAQTVDNDLKLYVDSYEKSQQGLTLWQMIKAGGFIMVVLGFLSIVAMTLIIYNFITLSPKTLSPIKYAEKVIKKLEEGQERSVKSMCRRRPNIIGHIVMAGLEKKHKGTVLAREAIENRSRREIGSLWQQISYLSDIASVAPLIGLLGTVLGMIQAFNVIAFQTAVVKPILLAGGVSKAMVTTAGGLMVAIPVMLFYSYFRGRVNEIANIVEQYSSDIIKIIVESSEDI